jgi:hypothetical protein
VPAVASRGDMRFMMIEKGSVNADALIAFLSHPIRGAGREIFSIVDRGAAHRTTKAGAFAPPLAIAHVLSPFRYAGPQPRRVGGEAFESGGRVAAGSQGRFRKQGSPLAAHSAKWRATFHLLLSKGLTQIRRVNMDILTDGRINPRPGICSSPGSLAARRGRAGTSGALLIGPPRGMLRRRLRLLSSR